MAYGEDSGTLPDVDMVVTEGSPAPLFETGCKLFCPLLGFSGVGAWMDMVSNDINSEWAELPWSIDFYFWIEPDAPSSTGQVVMMDSGDAEIRYKTFDDTLSVHRGALSMSGPAGPRGCVHHAAWCSEDWDGNYSELWIDGVLVDTGGSHYAGLSTPTVLPAMRWGTTTFTADISYSIGLGFIRWTQDFLSEADIASRAGLAGCCNRGVTSLGKLKARTPR